MSTFAVFGMTRAYALAEGRERIPTRAYDAEKQTTRELLEPEWLERVEAYADRVMKGRRRVQLSPLYDAPGQPIEIAKGLRDTADSRDLTVRFRGIKTGKDGVPILTKKRKKPRREWKVWTGKIKKEDIFSDCSDSQEKLFKLPENKKSIKEA